MSVITVQKSRGAIQEMLDDRLDLPIVVVGCDRCGRTCRTGGAAEVQELKRWLESCNFPTLAPGGLVDAVEEDLCDEEATGRRLAPLQALEPTYQVLVLACGAGLMCVRSLLGGVRLIPGLDTLGPGVGDRLACLACGDCGFGPDGCRRTPPLQRQVNRLTAGYEATANRSNASRRS